MHMVKRGASMCALDTLQSPRWGLLTPAFEANACLSPTEELQKSARPRAAVERGLDVASEQPPLRGRVGKTAVRKALYLDHSERPELVAVRLQHVLLVE